MRLVIGSGAAALLLVAGTAWWFMSDTLREPKDTFARAEYYFNADDDPSGPYDLSKARMYYEEVLNASSTAHLNAWYQLGRIDFLEGHFTSAIRNFDMQLMLFGDQLPNVYYMLGLTYGFRAQITEQPSDWEQAEMAFTTFIEYEPAAPWPRVDLAWVHFMQGNYEEMLPILEEGLVSSPDNAWLHNMYGLALLNTDDAEGALTHFSLAAEHAAQLTVHEWGLAYPGNDPAAWPVGLASFREAIEKNRALAEDQLARE